MIGSEYLSRAPDTRGDLIQDQWDPHLVAEFSDPAQRVRRIEPHATGSLNHGLENDRDQFASVRQGETDSLRGHDFEERAGLGRRIGCQTLRRSRSSMLMGALLRRAVQRAKSGACRMVFGNGGSAPSPLCGYGEPERN